MDLEYQLSNGRWVSCRRRAHDNAPEIDSNNEFLQKCVKYNLENPYILNKLSEEEIIEALKNGKELEYGTDWNNNIRSKDFAIEESKRIWEATKYRMANPKYESVEQFDAREDEQ